MGLPPGRIDVITSIDGVTFEEIWESRVSAHYGGVAIEVPSPEMLIKNKRAAGRPKDLVDVEALERALRRRT